MKLTLILALFIIALVNCEILDFQSDFEDWKQDSWTVEKWQDLQAKYSQNLPAPFDVSNATGGLDEVKLPIFWALLGQIICSTDTHSNIIFNKLCKYQSSFNKRLEKEKSAVHN